MAVVVEELAYSGQIIKKSNGRVCLSVRIDAVVSHGQFRSSTPSFVMRRALFQLHTVDVRGDGDGRSSGSLKNLWKLRWVWH